MESRGKSSDLSSLKPAECGFRASWKEVEITNLKMPKSKKKDSVF